MMLWVNGLGFGKLDLCSLYFAGVDGHTSLLFENLHFGFSFRCYLPVPSSTGELYNSTHL